MLYSPESVELTLNMFFADVRM